MGVNDMRVKSAVDWWMSILIWMAIVMIVIGVSTTSETERVAGVMVGLPILAVLLWIYFGTYYEFRENYLYCRSGPFFEKIPYDKVKSVKLSRNILSSMALSTKRIEIRQHGRGYILGTTFISPVNREEFMKELIQRCGNLDWK
jgi:uncharacterized membrane protein YobD (UPF0266 family)